MNQPRLGLLQKVPLREIWDSEAESFTPWLGREENLRLLGDTIGIELELEAQEKDVGPFRADLLCKNTLDDTWVLIENQLERTDHNHLGQLLTYAAGLEAATIVWIAERFTEEHRATMDWLNELTHERFTFLGLEIELWKIGSSEVAPKFNIVSKPNDWTKTVQASAKRSGELSEHRELQLRFWTAFRSFMEQKSSIKCQKAWPQHWMNHSIGRSGIHLASIVSSWDSEKGIKSPEIRVELILDGDKSKEHFDRLEREKAQIESEIGEPLIWHNPSDKRMSRIYLKQSADFTVESLWPEQHGWLKENLEKFKRVFGPRVAKF